MQPDQITLAVDVLANNTLVDEIFTRYEEQTNRSTYIGVGHLPDDRNTMGLYRTQPTRAGNFKGVGKSSVKMTKDITVSGVDNSTSLTAPIIFDFSASVPVGATIADLVHERERMIAVLRSHDFMNSLQLQMMV